ncbi:hypothetical protein Zmor_024118 [Zophobas morio]|uniref:Transposable element P transposase n=1 Tax=Zophobas morio TaxID=2755281 RepID=A0AA38HZK3_9CUCU|nr:hypothetical protein Zmor_024118 [Zophobas morio]
MTAYKKKAESPLVLKTIYENTKLTLEEKTTLEELIKASKVKNSKGRRYSQHWLLLCLLMHIRSPGGYKFIRNMNILPLPTPKTIRSYLRLVDTKCGFDKNFFQLLKKKLEKKRPFQRHAVLLFDEMQPISETMNTKKKATTINEKASHALVFMIQAIGDSYTQPIGVFASKGPVDGTTIAQLVIKAIILLEKAGVYIHGLVCDGAQTNRKAWSIVGVNGNQVSFRNSFEHPLTPERKVFVFSDTPHLIKTIRNRLFNNGALRVIWISPEDDSIKWEHFCVMHEEELKLPANLRACPKITNNHVNLSNTGKMRVKLATQIFSKSVADGLKLYMTQGTPRLQDCLATSQFCLKINNMFDSLNRKIPAHGVRPGSKDYYTIIEDSIRWLNDWEDNYKSGKIDSSEFLTKNTAEGLHVTLHSALCKINQDSLEKFFGTIRLAGGQNDHPATPTFLQLYKLLSVYSLLKPPKYGNCSVTEDKAPITLLTLEDIRTAYQDKHQEPRAIDHLKTRLNGLIHETDWEIDEILEIDRVVPRSID